MDAAAAAASSGAGQGFVPFGEPARAVFPFQSTESLCYPDQSAFAARLRTAALGRRFQYHHTVTTTMDLAKEQLATLGAEVRM